nr:30S ribosomal protein S9 [Cyclobacteriaceae bacterium]
MEIFNATGRRKTSVARVYVKPGKGDIIVNARDLKEYFLSEIHQTLVKQPLTA